MADRYLYGEYMDRERFKSKYDGLPSGYSTNEGSETDEIAQLTPIIIQRYFTGEEEVVFMYPIRLPGESNWVIYSTIDSRGITVEEPHEGFFIIKKDEGSFWGNLDVMVNGDEIVIESFPVEQELILYNRETGCSDSLVATKKSPIRGLTINNNTDHTWGEPGKFVGQMSDRSSTNTAAFTIFPDAESVGLSSETFPLIMGYKSVNVAREAVNREV